MTILRAVRLIFLLTGLALVVTTDPHVRAVVLVGLLTYWMDVHVRVNLAHDEAYIHAVTDSENPRQNTFAQINRVLRRARIGEGR